MAADGTWHYYGPEKGLTSSRSGTASGQDLQEDALVFRQYQLVPGARMLLLDGKPVKLGSRAFDLLHVLLNSRGRLVSKDEIVRHVWPDTTVEESNLRFQMGCLRKALGSDRDLIKTIPGRGYILATEVPVIAQGV
jgi:DNA-binding winged helix-turn-helix (wHTH) protein